MITLGIRRFFAQRPSRALWAAALGLPAYLAAFDAGLSQEAPVREAASQSIEHRVEAHNERLEMTALTSKILSIGANIPKVLVNNPEILDLTILGKDKVQISAKRPGVTQVVLWNEGEEAYTLDVIVFADARDLTMLLKSQFPRSDIRVTPIADGVILHGYVDDLNDVGRILDLAKAYHPKVHDNLKVAGAQQVLLQVKVMEVSRTKLRTVGADLARLGSAGDYAVSTISGLASAVEPPSLAAGVTRSLTGPTFQFGIVDGAQQFFGVLEVLQQRNAVKILAEPTLTAISGREAWFNDGGELPILVQSGLGTTTTQWKPFGTQVDFVPIVQGNGAIRLEVRPRVSEPDYSRVNSQGTPAIVVREVDTGVEMKPGQTLVIAGLIQTKESNEARGLPWISDLPWIGVPFRKNKTKTEETELLVMVTPYLVDPLDPHEVPQCGPGMGTTQPSDWDFYIRGHVEVPACGVCGDQGCNCGHESGEAPEEAIIETESDRPVEVAPGQNGAPAQAKSARSRRPSKSGVAIASDAADAPAARKSAFRPVSKRAPAGARAMESPQPIEAAPLAPKAETRPRRSPPKVERLPAVEGGRSSSRRRIERLPPVEKDDSSENTPPGLIGPIGYDVDSQ